MREHVYYQHGQYFGDLRNLAGFGPFTSITALDTICRQQPDAEGMVTAAIEKKTNKIIPWAEYMADDDGPGKLGSPLSQYATPGYDTVRGTCGLLANESFALNDVPVHSNHKHNTLWRTLIQYPLNTTISVPPFECFPTAFTWWQALYPNKLALRDAFRDKLHGLPPAVWQPWVGLHYTEDSTLDIEIEFNIPPCSAAWIGTIIVQRYVYAYTIFQVHQYSQWLRTYGYNSPTWGNKGGIWATVYASREVISCHALTATSPDGPIARAYPLHFELPETACPESRSI
jgi:hypothetical protein